MLKKYTHAPYSFLEELAGVYTKYQKPLDNDVLKAQWTNGGECAVSMCYDAYECNEGTKSLAHYVAGEFAPLSVITEPEGRQGQCHPGRERPFARGYFAACGPRAHFRSERKHNSYRAHGRTKRDYRRGDRK